MKFFSKTSANKQDIVGAELAKVLPDTEDPWYRCRHLLSLNVLLLVPLLSSSAVGYDGSMMNGLQTLSQWRDFFNRPSPSLLGVINAVYPVCKVLGLFPASWLSDKYGRRCPIMIGLVLLLVGPALQASSQTLAMFIVSRGLIGVATVFIILPSPILVAELAYPLHRGKITALFSTFFYFGAIGAAWSTFATSKLNSTWSWRIPVLLQAAIPAIQLALIYWVPESPRWLIANSKVEHARDFFIHFHAGDVSESPLVDFEVTEIEVSLRREQSQKSQANWMTLFQTAPNRKRSLLAFILGFFCQWNGIAVVFYYLSLVLNSIGITTTAEQALINGLLQLFNFAASVFAGALMVDRIGRRRLFLVSTGGLFLSYVAWTVCTGVFVQKHNASAGRAVVVFIFVAYFFYDIAWTPLVQAYTIEIFPYTLRSRGLTVTLAATYAGLISGQLINPVALSAIGWQYYIVFCCILAGLLVAIYLLFPETKGRSLEEIAEIFEGKKLTPAPIGQRARDDAREEVEPLLKRRSQS